VKGKGNDMPADVRAWITAFQSDAPLYKSFPLILPNGGRVTKFSGVCSACEQLIDPEMVRGRVMWSLPTVATVEGSGYCSACQRITHLHCRFRAHGTTYKVEWPGSDGRWHTKIAPPSSPWRLLVQRVVRFLCSNSST
jgi:hypothetical protein